MQALPCLDKVIELVTKFPDDPDRVYHLKSLAYYEKGLIYRTLERYDEAIKCFDEVIEADSSDFDDYEDLSDDYLKNLAYSYKGSILHNLKRYNEVIANFLALDTNHINTK